MKSIYVSPEIMYEDFSLSSNIAVGCEFTEINATQDVCAYESDLGSVFTDSVGAACAFKPQDGIYDGLCYHVPTEASNIFNS